MSNATSILTTVNIRPEVDVYATYQRLSYKPWFALAEFVDNSTQNYYDHRERLIREYQHTRPTDKLRIEIQYDSESNNLTILDNANGMEIEELARALVLNRPPPDPSGRSEFGMGLKTAACWFGKTWTIETKRLGSIRCLTAQIHVPDLVANKTEEIPVTSVTAEPQQHFTKITIESLYNPIRGRTPSRIRDQLASIYRRDIASGEVEIRWNGEPVTFPESPILEEPLGNGEVRRWRTDVAFSVACDGRLNSLPVRGWVGIRIPASQRDAGFVLMRKGRVIVGGPGEGYKPTEIFGQGNTFRSQRLIGELDLDEWPVTQAKDAFDWSGGLEDAFVERLEQAVQEYMDKAEGYRSGTPIAPADMQLAAEPTQQLFENARFSSAIVTELDQPTSVAAIPATEQNDARPVTVSSGPVVYRLDLGTEVWEFRLYWQEQDSSAHWMQVHYPDNESIDIHLNMAHPFFAPHVANQQSLELINKFVLALALAERMARRIHGDGLIAPGDFRTFMNRVLRRVSDIEVKQ